MIMTIGLLPDAMEPGIHCVRTHWIRGFMAFQLVPRMRTVMVMVPRCPESGFLGRTARRAVASLVINNRPRRQPAIAAAAR